MSFWKFCFRVLGFFVCLTEIYQKWKRYITTPERQNFIFRSLVMLLKTKIYLHYQIHLGIYGIYYMMMILRNIFFNVTDISYFKSSESMSSLIWNYWENWEEQINNDYSVTRCMLCVMPHIYEYVLVNANGEHMKQFNTVIKTLFYGISGNEMNDTFDTFWSEYTSFNYKNGPFYCDYFI